MLRLGVRTGKIRRRRGDSDQALAPHSFDRAAELKEGQNGFVDHAIVV
jgi:hypothetical protein